MRAFVGCNLKGAGKIGAVTGRLGNDKTATGDGHRHTSLVLLCNLGHKDHFGQLLVWNWYSVSAQLSAGELLGRPFHFELPTGFLGNVAFT